MQTFFETSMRAAEEQDAHTAAAPHVGDAASGADGHPASPAAPEAALRVRALSKCHAIYAQPRDRLKHFLLTPLRQLLRLAPKQYFSEFWALRDVSFEVRKGESLAIIGRNGSGKSTLLQMICGTLSPTAGSVETSGRIAALLELGSGFNVEFTGRENVFLNGAILGMTRRQIEERLDDILAFADIGDFIDQPVKTYSSGMYVRLAFAIQVHVEPEILVVDEALSVGDFFFQQKCFARIRRMREEGLTLLYVSHDMGSVRDLCPRAVYLQKGTAVFVGDTLEAIRRYLSERDDDATAEQPAAAAIPAGSAAAGGDLAAARQVALWQRADPEAGNLLAVVVRDEDGLPATRVRMGGRLKFEVFFRGRGEEHDHISLTIKNRYDQVVFCTGTYHLGMDPMEAGPGGCAVLELAIDCMIEAGLYSVLVNFGPAGVPEPNRGVPVDETDWFGPIQVDWDYANEAAPFLGQVGLPVAATLRRADAPQMTENASGRPRGAMP